MTFILILAAGNSSIGEQQPEYPLPLIELGGVLLIEKTINACLKIPDAQILCAIRQHDARKHHLDQVINILAPSGMVIPVQQETAGAACTALLAMEYINCNRPLLIVNLTDFIDADYTDIINDFVRRNLDAGAVTFPSVHPRYSFVRLDADGYIIEAAEKNPISRNATAGVYWYARGSDFTTAVQRMILKDAHINSRFYICPAFNEMILNNARIGTYAISPNQYHPLKSYDQLQRFELQSQLEPSNHAPYNS